MGLPVEMVPQDPMGKMHGKRVKVVDTEEMVVAEEMENPVEMVKMPPASVEMVEMVEMERRVVVVLMAVMVEMDSLETTQVMEEMVREELTDQIYSSPSSRFIPLSIRMKPWCMQK